MARRKRKKGRERRGKSQSASVGAGGSINRCRILNLHLPNRKIQLKQTCNSGVGSTKDEMEAAYGTDYSVVGTECIYAKGNSELRIIVEGDKVSSIQIVSTNVPDVAEAN